MYCALFLFHTIILRNPQGEISWEFCKMRPNGEILIRDNSAFICDTQSKVTAEHGRAVASVWGSVCLCACENLVTCALCSMRNLGLELFCCNWVFLLSACPCVLRYTCGFSTGVPVLSVYGFLCICGTARGRANFKITFPDFPPGRKPKWKWSRERKWN